MAKVFRQLMLAAVNGGKRYIRAMMAAVFGMTAKVISNPGKTIKANASVIPPEIEGSVVAQPSSNCTHKASLAVIRMAAQVFVKLVSNPVYKGEYQQMNLSSKLGMATSNTAQGYWKLFVGIFTKASTGIGQKLESKNELHGSYTNSVLGKATPERIVSKLRSEKELLANALSNKTSDAKANTKVLQEILAGLKSSKGAELGDDPFLSATNMTAQLITWVAPEMVNEKTLYIKQVYEIEQDGNVLILH